MKNSYRWWNIIGLTAMLAVNGLAEWLPINGKTTGELSAKYPVLITPAPYAFSIWSIIYLLLIGFVAYQLRPRTAQSSIVQSIGPWFLISCLLNMAWILVWHYERLNSSVFVMFALLLSLIIIYTKIRTAKVRAVTGERLLVWLPFSIYLGWISTATIVNVSVALYAANWDGFGLSDIAWTIIMLIAAGCLALFVGFKHYDPAYTIVLIWSFIAIAKREEQQSDIILAALIGACVLAVAAVFILIQASKSKKITY
ncbi:hypothetical protein FHS15_001168 [Paenibacillus castaneae]|uniref:tryptophan-rich sensory protein n=1 Tax=Paenibacillus castaneae TaxID=474957 RepID=UPI000C9A4591|nr:tryptophan-rich sensory protein [Paenibacillus castaneae]NIK76061.1 hypothetical protein [Paenibacillus castaneae]